MPRRVAFHGRSWLHVKTDELILEPWAPPPSRRPGLAHSLRICDFTQTIITYSRGLDTFTLTTCLTPDRGRQFV